MKKYNLLKSLPNPKRNVKMRESTKTNFHIDISRQYGEEYFDGDRSVGYGGYRYDGRWKPVAKDIVKYYSLKKGDKFLDIGCAKGFLVQDMLDLGIDAYGADISEYAIKSASKKLQGRLHICDAKNLYFPNKSFDVVVSINTIHNLEKQNCLRALREVQRLAKKGSFVQVDSYMNEKQKKIFESWVLTAKYYDYTHKWVELFRKAKYTGEYYWTII